MCAGTGKGVHIIIFTCARISRKGNETVKERKQLFKIAFSKSPEVKRRGSEKKKAERRKGIGEIDTEKKEKLKSKRMLYQVQLEKKFH